MVSFMLDMLVRGTGEGAMKSPPLLVGTEIFWW